MTRIAVIFAGDARDPSAWSGTPAGIVAGLESAGAEVVVLRAGLESRFDRLLLRLIAAPEAATRFLRSRDWHTSVARAKSGAKSYRLYLAIGATVARRGLRAAGPLDGAVQIGTSYVVRHPRLVTFEDMTIPQGLESPWFGLQSLSARTLRRRRRTQAAAYGAAFRACAATPWTAGSIVADYGVDPAKVLPVGLGGNHGGEAVARDWSRPRFLFIGKDWADKNGPALLDAFASVRDRIPEATLDLVGHHPPVSQDGVTGHGYLHLADPAARARMADLLGGSTCLVVPTSFEPAGIAYIEAAAAGLPCIGTSRGGARDIIGPGGLVVNPASVDDLAAAMLHICDPATAQAFGAAGAARSRLLTWTSVGRRLLQAMGLQSHDPADWEGLFDPQEGPHGR